MTEKLKPCPFCRNNAHVYAVTGRNHYVICNHCESRTAEHRTPEEAITTWNTRAYEPKSGTWKLESEFEGTKTWECPFCHHVYYFDDLTYKFCPACGAHLEMEEQS